MNLYRIIVVSSYLLVLWSDIILLVIQFFCQDVMILDQSVFFGVADMQDRHRDMRLDVDNMSYEVNIEYLDMLILIDAHELLLIQNHI